MSSKFDPQKHHRRSIRLPNYDYSQPGAYYVTIVAWQRKYVFGEVLNGEMKLNKVGEIVQWEWEELPRRLPYIELGAFVVMPNHFHGILIFHDNVGATRLGLTNALSGKVSLPNVTTEGIEALTPWTQTCLLGRDHGTIQITRDQTVVEDPLFERNPDMATQLLRTCHPQRKRFEKQNGLRRSESHALGQR